MSESPAQAALEEALRRRRVSDPLAGARVGAAEIRQRLLQALHDGRGVHVESLLALAGGLAGQAAQASLRARSLADGEEEFARFQRVGTRDGRSFLVGAALTELLADGENSLWGRTAAAARNAGCGQPPDPAALFERCIATLGTPEFGSADVPSQHQPAPAALEALPALWPNLLPLVRRCCPDPIDWPVLFALLAEDVITLAKDVIDPCLALRLVMETAIAQAKVPLSTPCA